MSLEAAIPPYNSADPTANFLSSSCLDFLLIELVPLAHRVTRQINTGARGAPLAAGQVDASSAASSHHGGNTVASSTGGVATSSRRLNEEEDEEGDAVFHRLDGLGYRVGQGLVERFSRDRPRFNDTLDVIKFLCKDLWNLVFGKQVDNLKTNHRGVYVLTDNAFRPLSKMSTEVGGHAVTRAKPFLYFPCGIVRGALAAMGITATVMAETNEALAAVFHIKTMPSDR